MDIVFRRQRVEARVLNPFKGHAEEVSSVEIRWDPLLEHTSRIIERSLQPQSLPDLSDVIERTSNCFFCDPRIESETPRILPGISSEGRLRSGRAILFPNLGAYAKYSAVAVFSTDHFTHLAELTPKLIADVLEVSRRYAELVYAYDRTASHCSVNANFLPSAGGSIIHPHVQISVDPVPTTIPRLTGERTLEYWREHQSSYWSDLIEKEQQLGERYIGRTGVVEWLAGFAPLGFDEVQAVVPGRSTLLELGDSDLRDLAEGISRVLRYYSDMNHNSYNFAIYSAPLDGPGEHFNVHLRLITRSNYDAYYRSDATYFERLHWEYVVSGSPEATAAALRHYIEA